MKPLLTKDNIYLSITRGMKASAKQVMQYGLGVEIQDFALLSGMRANLEENLKFWHDFLETYKPSLSLTLFW